MNDTPNIDSCLSTVWRGPRCSSEDLENMKTSSRYRNANFHLTVNGLMSIVLWIFLGAFYRTNGILKHLQPVVRHKRCFVLVLVVGLDFPIPRIGFYVENMRASPAGAKHSSIRRIGQVFLKIPASCILCSIQSRSKKSFLGANTNGNVYIVCGGLTKFMQSISSISRFLNSRAFCSARYEVQLIGCTCCAVR